MGLGDFLVGLGLGFRYVFIGSGVLFHFLGFGFGYRFFSLGLGLGNVGGGGRGLRHGGASEQTCDQGSNQLIHGMDLSVVFWDVLVSCHGSRIC
ncbi:hypothetical protein D3C85_1740500 [compost metagenome]